MFRQFHKECPTVFASTANFTELSRASRPLTSEQPYVELTHPSITFEQFSTAVRQQQHHAAASAHRSPVKQHQQQPHGDDPAAVDPPSRSFATSAEKIAAKRRGAPGIAESSLGAAGAARSGRRPIAAPAVNASTPPQTPEKLNTSATLSDHSPSIDGAAATQRPAQRVAPPPAPYESPAKVVLAQAELRSRSRSTEAGSRSGSQAHQAGSTAARSSLLSAAPREHHINTHRERLRALVQGLRVRAKLHCGFAATLRGQIVEINGLIDETRRQREAGVQSYFKEPALRTQKGVWCAQLADFLVSDDTFAAIHLSQLPPRGAHVFTAAVAGRGASRGATEPSAAAGGSPRNIARSSVDSADEADQPGSSAAAQVPSSTAGKVKMLRRGEGMKRMEKNLEKRRAEEQQQQQTQQQQPHHRSPSASAKAVAKPASRSSSLSAAASAPAAPRGGPAGKLGGTALLPPPGQQQQQQTTLTAPVQAGRRPAAAEKPLRAASSRDVQPDGGKLFLFTSAECEENATFIEQHIASIVAAATAGDGAPIQHGRINPAFLDRRRAHFVASLFPSATEMRADGRPRRGGAVAEVQRIEADSAFFRVFDHRRYHETKEIIEAL